MPYEVQCHFDRRWQTERLFDKEEPAVAFAKSKLAAGKVDAVRVIEEKPSLLGGSREKLVFEQAATNRAKPAVMASAVESAPHCDSLADVYALPARQVIGRVLRSYLAQEGLSALEILSSSEQLKQLVRRDDLLNQAVGIVAAVQVRQSGGTMRPHDRATELFAILGEITEMLKADRETAPLAQELAEGRIAALSAHLDTPLEPARRRILALCAIGRTLSREAEPAAKIGLLLDMDAMAGGDERIAPLIDDILAEILDDQGAVRQILGRRANLADAMAVVLGLITARRGSVRGDEPVLARLEAALKTGRYPFARAALDQWLDRALRSIQPLTKEDRAANRAAFAAIVTAMETQFGLVGGPSLAEAILLRGRTVLFGPDEEQKSEQALVRFLRLLSTPGCQLGFLLDLLEAPSGTKIAASLMRHMVEVLRAVPDLATLTDLQGENAERLREGFCDRVARSNLPPPIRTAMMTLLEKLRLSADSPAPAMAQSGPAPSAARDPDQLELASGQLLFQAGDRADCAFLVLSGRIGIVTIVNGQELPLATVSPGGVAGDSALAGSAVRSNTARAIQPSLVRRIGQDRFDLALEGLAQSDPDALAVVNSLRMRLRDLARRGVAV